MSSSNVLPFPVPAQRRPTLQSLLGMTHDMLALAKLGDWDGALNLQLQRRDALELFFADVPATLSKVDIATAIRAILQFGYRAHSCGSSILSTRSSRGLLFPFFFF